MVHFKMSPSHKTQSPRKGASTKNCLDQVGLWKAWEAILIANWLTQPSMRRTILWSWL